MSMIGARETTDIALLAPLRRLIARATAHELRALVVPGPDLALAAGLDLAAAGLVVADGPRQANVLLLVGPLSPGIRDAASVAYAQMSRPRAVLALGADETAPLPAPDAVAGLSQAGLTQALAALRAGFAGGAFAAQVGDFEAPALQSRVEYTCPMHPEVVSDEPGNCPKCGMFLVPRETSAPGHDHDHGAGTAASARSDPQTSAPIPDAGHDGTGGDMQHHAAATQYTCPMHPQVVRDEPGNCPECGMTLIPVEAAQHGGHALHNHSAHGGHDAGGDTRADAGAGVAAGWLERIEPGFMSMIEMTQGTPRSSDGLQMEWITVPFGPFFPGLPGGLTLEFRLDGDTVAEARAGSLVGAADLLPDGAMPAAQFVANLGARMPLAPVSYRLLACRALERAAEVPHAPEVEAARDAALERERIASHLLWLAQLGRQLGLSRIAREAAALQLAVRGGDLATLRGLIPRATRLIARVRGTGFLARRLATVGKLPSTAAGWSGPGGAGDSAAERLAARLAEIADGFTLIDAAPALAEPELAAIGAVSGHGQAGVTAPRGMAHLQVTLDAGKVVSADLRTPSARHVGLVAALTEQRELGDALVAVASLDLDPWEIGA